MRLGGGNNKHLAAQRLRLPASRDPVIPAACSAASCRSRNGVAVAVVVAAAVAVGAGVVLTTIPLSRNFDMSVIASRTLRKSVHLYAGARALSTKPPTVKNFINGKFEESKTQQWIEVVNPATQEVVSLLPQTTPEELARAEAGAQEAYLKWKEVSISQRQRVFFKFQQLIRDHTENLAHSITTEQGKTLADARGDVFRGLEVIESACGVAPLMMGETLGNLARGLDTYSYRQPLGVVAG